MEKPPVEYKSRFKLVTTDVGLLCIIDEEDENGLVISSCYQPNHCGLTPQQAEFLLAGTNAIEQAREETAREIFEEIERERFAEPQHIPESGKEPVIICLTESILQPLKDKFLKHD